MRTSATFLIIAVPASILGILLLPTAPLGQAIWPPAPGPAPTGGALVALAFAGIVSAIAFGAGIAFLVTGRRALAAAAPQSRGLATMAYLSIAWGLVSWVPHAALHQSTAAGDFGRLVAIEYAFHLTLIAAAGILALFFVRVLQAPRRAAETQHVVRTVVTAAR